jgi:hypothetical protein
MRKEKQQEVPMTSSLWPLKQSEGIVMFGPVPERFWEGRDGLIA